MFNESQITALAVAPKTTSTLSIIGSIFIIIKVLKSPLRRSRSHHRLLAGMSVCDFFASFATFLSTWPIPIGTRGVRFAVGNITSCTIQGFMANFNIAVALYNTCLAMYYLLIVRYKITTERMKKIELMMHLIPFSYAVLFGMTLAIDTSFNPAGQYCWVAQVPFGCSGDNCLRGRRAASYQWFIFGIICTCLIVSTFATFLLYWTVYRQDKAIEANLSKPECLNKSRRKRKSREVAKQATLYIGAFYITWIFSIANRVYALVHASLLYGLLITASIIHPLQGAMNLLVYMRKDLRTASDQQTGFIAMSSSMRRRISSMTNFTPRAFTTEIDQNNQKALERIGTLNRSSSTSSTEKYGQMDHGQVECKSDEENNLSEDNMQLDDEHIPFEACLDGDPNSAADVLFPCDD